MISERIKTIVKKIPPYTKIADCGCDHGYAIIEAVMNYHVTYALAIDNKIDPLNSAKSNMKEILNNCDGVTIEFSCSNGLDELDETVEAVIISGMGGVLIADILNAAYEKGKLKKVNRLILEPNRNVNVVRKTLNNLSYEIVNEAIVFEDDKYYEIITADYKDKISKLNADELDYGPYFLKEKPELFKQYYQYKIRKFEKINTEKLNKEIERIKKICL